MVAAEKNSSYLKITIYCNLFFQKQDPFTLESAVRTIIPKIPQEMTSPAPTVSIISGDRKIYTISVVKNERYDHCVGDDWRQWCKPFAGTAQLVSKNCTDQCCNTSENDIYRNRTAKKIGKNTSYK